MEVLLADIPASSGSLIVAHRKAPEPVLVHHLSQLLAFQIVHPLTVEQNMNALNRVYAALAPRGTLAELGYCDNGGHTNDFKCLLHLQFHIASGATYTERDLQGCCGRLGSNRCGWLGSFASLRRR